MEKTTVNLSIYLAYFTDGLSFGVLFYHLEEIQIK